MKHATFLLLVLGCSEGKFENRKDHQLSVFGFSLSDQDLLGAGAYLGRVVSESGQPVVNAQVFIEHENLATFTNQKGGFLVPTLQPGAHRIFVVFNNLIGAAVDVEVVANEIVEQENIVLRPLVPLSGEVFTDTVTRAEAKVFVEGTPFSSDADLQGRYQLALPLGQYQISAKHMLYETFTSEVMEIDEGATFDIRMKPYEYPAAVVKLNSKDQYVVRGLKTVLTVVPTVSVVAMKVMKVIEPGMPYGSVATYGESTAKLYTELDQDNSPWEPLQETIEIEATKEGYSSVSILLCDAFGKISKPIEVAFYNTLLDESWNFYHGKVKQAVTIGAGEKVVFMPRYQGRHAFGQVPPYYSYLHSNCRDCGGYYSNTAVFSEGVKILEGAVVRGGAYFEKSLEIAGTAEKPVDWDLQGNSVSVDGAALLHARVTNGLIVFGSSKQKSQTKIQHSRLSALRVQYQLANATSGRIEVNRSRLEDVILSVEVWDGDEEEAISDPRLHLTLFENDFLNAGVEVRDVVNALGVGKLIWLSVHRNNFHELKEGPSSGPIGPGLVPAPVPFYFMVSGTNLKKARFLELNVGDNYFAEPDRLYDGAEGDPWWFGTKLDQPLENIGS